MLVSNPPHPMSGGINPAHARVPASIPSNHDRDSYILREICRSRDDVSRSRADVDQQQPPHDDLRARQLLEEFNDQIGIEP